MLNKELNALQEELNYHRNSIQELEERIAEVKVYDGYAAQATEAVEDAIEQIGMGKYLWLFKEHILSMFPEQPPALHSSSSRSAYLQDKIEENIVPLTEVRGTEVPQEVEEVKPKKSYYELTGKPDLRPTKYEDLAPNITYSSDGRCYIGFNDKQEAEKFREGLVVPCMLDKAQIMNNHKWEVKLYCDRQYLNELLQELEDDWTPEQKAELDFQERLIRIAPDIFYDPAESICHLGFRAKGRADTYGSYLSRILDIAEKYVVTNKPRVITNTKYELRLEDIELGDAKHLANFNLKKDYDHPDHREVREVWRTTRQREMPPACKPLPRSTPLEEIKLGEIVCVGTNAKQYKVLDKVELDGIPHLEVVAIYNSEMPALVGKTSYLKEVYRVLKDDIRIDLMFDKEKELVLASQKGADFPTPPYKSIPLSEVELADIVTTNPNSQSAYEVTANLGDHLLATCLYNHSLKHREGQKDFWITEAYLVEKASILPTVEAA